MNNKLNPTVPLPSSYPRRRRRAHRRALRRQIPSHNYQARSTTLLPLLAFLFPHQRRLATMDTVAGGTTKKKMMASGDSGEGFGSGAAQIGRRGGCGVGGVRNWIGMAHRRRIWWRRAVCAAGVPALVRADLGRDCALRRRGGGRRLRPPRLAPRPFPRRLRGNHRQQDLRLRLLWITGKE